MKSGVRPQAERAANPAVRFSGQLRSPQGIEAVRIQSRARQRALTALVRLHREEFDALWVDRGSTLDAEYGNRRDAAKRALASNYPLDFRRLFDAERAREDVS